MLPIAIRPLSPSDGRILLPLKPSLISLPRDRIIGRIQSVPSNHFKMAGGARAGIAPQRLRCARNQYPKECRVLPLKSLADESYQIISERCPSAACALYPLLRRPSPRLLLLILRPHPSDEAQ